MDIAFTIQLFNAVLPHVAFMFRSDDIFNLHFLSHMACTQTYVDKSTLPPPFRMVTPTHTCLCSSQLSPARHLHPAPACIKPRLLVRLDS